VLDFGLAKLAESGRAGQASGASKDAVSMSPTITGRVRRLTLDGINRYPIWSPDGRYVVFQSDQSIGAGLFRQVADGSQAAERLTTADLLCPLGRARRAGGVSCATVTNRTLASRAVRVLPAGFPTPSSALLRAGGARRACVASWGCPSRRHPLE
jgi:WD40-like Beta Propeller Repeat